jgi:asparagine synthetase B (glutamine-hydrolysing)
MATTTTTTTTTSTSNSTPIARYTSRCCVLLSGLGADELFAGYGRHRTTFKTRGLAAL